jgi:hypothetical protein
MRRPALAREKTQQEEVKDTKNNTKPPSKMLLSRNQGPIDTQFRLSNKWF